MHGVEQTSDTSEVTCEQPPSPERKLDRLILNFNTIAQFIYFYFICYFLILFYLSAYNT